MTRKGESCEEGEAWGRCACAAAAPATFFFYLSKQEARKGEGRKMKRKRKRRDQIDGSIREEGQMGALILGLPQPQEGEEGPKREGE
jgi:hypothetical protein